MQIILLERVEKLGGIGDVVTVKDGFARNFLLPRKKALRANDANRRVFEANRERIEADNAERRDAAKTDAEKVDGTKITLIRQASNTGQLYGSVSVRDLVDALAEDGKTVTRSQVVLERAIKTVGLTEVKVVLHPEVTATITVNVARTPDEAELQEQGVDVLAQNYDRAGSGFTEDYDPNAEPGATADAVQAEAAEDTVEQPTE